jgi:hypothetical protein
LYEYSILKNGQEGGERKGERERREARERRGREARERRGREERERREARERRGREERGEREERERGESGVLDEIVQLIDTHMKVFDTKTWQFVKRFRDPDVTHAITLLPDGAVMGANNEGAIYHNLFNFVFLFFFFFFFFFLVLSLFYLLVCLVP